ncbi:MAG: TIGR03503 family protein [Thalassotalea sp.]
MAKISGMFGHSHALANNLKRLCFSALLVSFLPVSALAAEKSVTELKYYEDDNVTNQIPYFDNRFRIDAQLEEITLLFYRVAGSPPSILVRPDGSKLKVNNYDRERVEWFDDRTFDMIKIKNPMPGPWQVIGNVLPKSKIMVLTDIKLSVQPLPEVILAGETLKISATLHNGDMSIDQPAFRDVVQLNVDFYSTNNADYENFGADIVELTSFRDDGRELDEYAADGIFTGEFELKIAAGEWEPVYTIKLPMAERKLAQKPIILRKSPVLISVAQTTSELGHHKVKLSIDNHFVKPESMIFQGKITFPNKEIEPFSVMEGEGGDNPKQRIIEFGYTEPGVHRLNINAFGETINGREFRLVLHEFTFNVENKLSDDFISSDLAGDDSADAQQILMEKIKAQTKAAEIALAELQAEQKIQQEAKEQIQLFIIIAGNILLFIIAAVGFWLFKRKQKAK